MLNNISTKGQCSRQGEHGATKGAPIHSSNTPHSGWRNTYHWIEQSESNDSLPHSGLSTYTISTWWYNDSTIRKWITLINVSQNFTSSTHMPTSCFHIDNTTLFIDFLANGQSTGQLFTGSKDISHQKTVFSTKCHFSYKNSFATKQESASSDNLNWCSIEKRSFAMTVKQNFSSLEKPNKNFYNKQDKLWSITYSLRDNKLLFTFFTELFRIQLIDFMCIKALCGH